MSLSLTQEEKSSASSRLNRDRRLAKAMSFSMSGRLLRKSWSGGRSGGSDAIGGYTEGVILGFGGCRGILTPETGPFAICRTVEVTLGKLGWHPWNCRRVPSPFSEP